MATSRTYQPKKLQRPDIWFRKEKCPLPPAARLSPAVVHAAAPV